MARQTSVDTYHQIQSEGLLSKNRLIIYKIVFENGPMTSAEAFSILNKYAPTRNITQSRARFTELRDMGVFTELGTKKCSITGRNTILWGCTNNLPIKLEKENRIKCKACKGKGYHTEQQARLF
jgi:hypothetical protein